MARGVEIRLGDMFSGPSDLIVLPCSTAGTVTDFVMRRLITYAIPAPRSQSELGDVEVLPFEGAENIAQYVAFATSVVNNTSTPASLRRIGERLAEFAGAHPAVGLISCPLLGSGAGGLLPETSLEALRNGFLSKPHDGRLALYVLQEHLYRQLAAKYQGAAAAEGAREGAPAGTMPIAAGPRPRVFISYTGSSDEHRRWVVSLAEFLRQNGVEARIDVWHLRPGMDLPQFMTNELSLASRVIIVSNEKYAAKADGRHGGVGWETMVIQGDLSRLPPEQTKYVVVVREEDLEKGLPAYLRTKYVLHAPPSGRAADLRQKLLDDLFYVDPAPPIGAPPVCVG